MGVTERKFVDIDSKLQRNSVEMEERRRVKKEVRRRREGEERWKDSYVETKREELKGEMGEGKERWKDSYV